MIISSTAFENKGFIPKNYTCDGSDVNPPLTFRDLPEGTKDIVLIVDDPDSPSGSWTHWVVWNVNPSLEGVDEGAVPEGALQGRNDFGNIGWGGPCPHGGTHRYRFSLYAIDSKITAEEGKAKDDILQLIKGHVLESAVLVGLYKRP
jgi:Raf kinase inhibitor-like YbhB/YbcL family protein